VKQAGLFAGSSFVILSVLAGLGACKTVGNRNSTVKEIALNRYDWADKPFSIHCEQGLKPSSPEDVKSFDNTLKVLGVNQVSDCKKVFDDAYDSVIDLSGKGPINLGLVLKLPARGLILRNLDLTTEDLNLALERTNNQNVRSNVQYLDLSHNKLTYSKKLFAKLRENVKLQFISLAHNQLEVLRDGTESVPYQQSFFGLPGLSVDLSSNPLVIDQNGFSNEIVGPFGHVAEGGTIYLNVSNTKRFEMKSLLGSSVAFLVATGVETIVPADLSEPLKAYSMFPSLAGAVTQGSRFSDPVKAASMLNEPVTWMKKASAFLVDDARVTAELNTQGKALVEVKGLTASCSQDIQVTGVRGKVTSVACPGELKTDMWGSIADPKWDAFSSDPKAMIIPLYK
jgi:hypothetical protein